MAKMNLSLDEAIKLYDKDEIKEIMADVYGSTDAYYNALDEAEWM